jgi:molecular chaperone GrpE (heat shock protein)
MEENVNVEVIEEVVAEETVKAIEEMSVPELCDFVSETAAKAKEVFTALEDKTFETKASVEKTVTALRKDLTAIHSGVTKTISREIFGMKDAAKEACAANSAKAQAKKLDDEIAALMEKRAALPTE